jgi:hypothetical protein
MLGMTEKKQKAKKEKSKKELPTKELVKKETPVTEPDGDGDGIGR